MSYKAVIIGCVPPPAGGVAAHIIRFLERLEKDRKDIQVEHINSTYFAAKWKRLLTPALLLRLISSHADLYHLHKPDHIISIWYVFLCLQLIGKKIIFTLHNENLADQLESTTMPAFKRFSLKLIFKCFDHIICVNQRTAKVLAKLGNVDPQRMSVIPAFIPQSKVDPFALPENIKAFAEKSKPLLTGYSQRIYLYNGNDRYGGDMMIDVVARLVKDFPAIGLILVMPNKSSDTVAGLEKYRSFIETHGITENVMICEDLIDLTSLFSISDVHVRPSNTDGDPIAVRESLHMSIPTIASDCTYKPDDTIFHKDRDFDDFEVKVRNVLVDVDGEKAKLAASKQPDFSQQVIDIYDATAKR